MSRFIEAAEFLLPPGGNYGINTIFNYVLAKEAVNKEMIIKNPNSLNQEKRRRLTKEVFITAIAYLIQRSGSPALNDIGYAAWCIIERNFAQIAVVKDLFTYANELGFSLRDAPTNYNPKLPVVFVRRKENDMKVVVQETDIAIPSDFLPFALENPVESLAATAGISSRLRDTVLLPKLRLQQKKNEPQFSSSEAHSQRSSASIAEVILEAKIKRESFQLSKELWAIFSIFPNGIESLPPKIWYKNPPFFPLDSDPEFN